MHIHTHTNCVDVFDFCLSAPIRFKDLQMCNSVMKSSVNQRQGLSTNAKACYDKLGEKVVAPLWFDECAQSISLSDFFLSLLGLEFSQLFFSIIIISLAEQLTPSD